MEIEVDVEKKQQDVVKEKDLFKAAEEGEASKFEALSLKSSLKPSLSETKTLVPFSTSQLLPVTPGYPFAPSQKAAGVVSADEEGWAPLHSAASIGNVEIVETLLNKGADVNLKNNGGRAALHYAASKGWVKITEMLISHDAKINIKDKVGCTPLHRASSTGKSELCELLIEEGAEVDAVDRAGQTPLMNAVICCNKEVALLLIRHGADVDVEDKEGYTVLGRATHEFRPILIDAAKAMLE